MSDSSLFEFMIILETWPAIVAPYPDPEMYISFFLRFACLSRNILSALKISRDAISSVMV
jgi:hypothetical protein